tara:strand:- start:8702 stop:9697 length:996 start_codon:yes stop_codon:yes gene_type:complete
MKNIIYLFFSLILIISSCVSPKIHNELLKNNKQINNDLKLYEKEVINLSSQLEELNYTISTIKKKIQELKSDSIQNGKALIQLKNKFNELNNAYEILESKNSRQLSEKAKEIKQLLDQLDLAQTNLLNKEDELNQISENLKIKENELTKAQNILEERSNKVIELEKIINQKDSIVSYIKEKVQKSLIGLEGDGITIVQENGKIYISLEEDLLFASGKYIVNKKGEEALSKLGQVLANQTNLEILVEGHTDNIPPNGKGVIKDNWDLSVLRATSVVKIFLKNKSLDPLQFTAAGRGEFNPVANNENPDGRKMNRRIELILSPNLDDLYEILE